MTDEEGAPRVRCNGKRSTIFDTNSTTEDPPHTVTCDSPAVSQFVWLRDADGLALCEVAVLEDTSGEGDATAGGGGGALQDLAELPLNLMVHLSGYVVDPTAPDAATAAPTPSPTSPTWAPTVPTSVPTFSPTASPTLAPTLVPTKGPNCANGREDGTETDVDCGGHGCPACADSQRCYEDLDCGQGEGCVCACVNCSVK
jgi:hypothetical protein